MFGKHRGQERRPSCPLFKKILRDSNPLENLFKKIVVDLRRKNGCHKVVKVSMTCWDLQMEAHVTQLSFAWGTAGPCTIALRCWRRECVLGTSSSGFPPATYTIEATCKQNRTPWLCTVFPTRSISYGLIVAALLWKMDVLIFFSPGTAVK